MTKMRPSLSCVVLALATAACGDSSPSARTSPLSLDPDGAVADGAVGDGGADECPPGDRKAGTRVLSQTLEGALLTLKLEFGGGCKAHSFSVGYGGAASDSLPPHIPLELNHYANDDSCDAILTREVIIDLSTLSGVKPPVYIDLVNPEGKALPDSKSILYEGPLAGAEPPEGTLMVRSECSHFTPL